MVTVHSEGWGKSRRQAAGQGQSSPQDTTVYGQQVHCGKNMGQWGNYIITTGVSTRRAEDIFR